MCCGENSIEQLEEIVVVEDVHEDTPTFARLLYMDLDFDMLKLYVMLFTAFDELLSSNSLLSLFLVYCTERIYRWLRQRLSCSNLSKKAYVDDRFLK